MAIKICLDVATTLIPAGVYTSPVIDTSDVASFSVLVWSSRDSFAFGLTFYHKTSAGAVITLESYSTSANTTARYDIKPYGPRMEIRFVNSAGAAADLEVLVQASDS